MKGKSPLILLILLVVGALIGSIIGEALSGMMPFLNTYKSIGISPSTLDLGFMQITFGFSLGLNIATALGLVLAFVMYKKL